MNKNFAWILSALFTTSSVSAQLVFEQKVIDEDINHAICVSLSDLNGDDKIDIVSASHSGHLRWYENKGQNNYTVHDINFSVVGAEEDCLCTCDMDKDGDKDIVVAETNANKVVWLENDGLGSFERHVIETTGSGPWDVYAIDIDGDGDVDVLCAANYSAEIIWLENNGSQSFARHAVAQNFNYATAVFAMDMDGDNDIDILGGAALGSWGQKGIIWWENIGNNFSTSHIVSSTFEAESVCAFDADNDSDIDILGSSLSQHQIFLWKNDGNQNFTQQTVAGNYGGAESLFTIDLDGDDDQDILAVGYWQENLDYWENDGAGNFTIQNIGMDYKGASKIYAADIDGDSDIDIATANTLKDDISIWVNQSIAVSTENSNPESKITVCPNPSSGTFMINTENDLLKAVKVADQAGQLVFDTKTFDNEIELSLLPSGIYFLTIEAEGKPYTQKIIIQ